MEANRKKTFQNLGHSEFSGFVQRKREEDKDNIQKQD